MPSQLSPAAKTNVAAVAAVVMAGVTAWQIATRGGFTWWDLIPVTAAVLGVATTDHVDNTIGSPKAKAVVHGALSLLAAVSASVAAVAGPEPSGVSATKLAVAALGTLAVWYVPELAAPVAVAQHAVASGAPLASVARAVVADVADSHSPWMAEPAAPAVVPTPRQADTVPSSAYLLRDLPKTAAAEPTPIADAARDAALTTTAPMPAVTA